ncbi:ERAD-associated E3 ubiquitin-protein ligase HRD1A [Hibiscus syriacus]|uniref:RING-type E3 ubiquitin transferase n=1 Tax=Hibiscus syriacus TaxID=106335 RepID=A0A6A2XDY7_HIBSY|nr:ERAD-associated E3 ubiquitin-protein ligase HRD1A [Hibiscus syriacus]
MSPSSEEERMEMSRVPYVSAVGSLMFVMICTRPDIVQAVGVVSRYMVNLGKEHWNIVKRILRYIKGTSNIALCYGGSNLLINGYVDSDYARDLDKSKSTTGYVFKVADGAVSWVSKLQSVVATSTTEVEHVAATQASKETIWLKMLLEELGHNQEYVSLFCDSQSALHLTKNPSFNSRTKHIRVQYHFIREKVEEGTVNMQKIHTKDNIADFITKAVNVDKFTWCRSSCGLSETYMILATTIVSNFIKYCFYVSDMLMEGQWEKKPVYTFYLELIQDLLHLSMYLFFFLVIFMNYGVPLHLIRELYETFRNFKIRVADYMHYRKIASNMNDRFPDATPEELTSNDATCIICREEMTTANKLICGHLFHVHCLRSWLERQHTCPTCKALVVPPENGTSSSGGQHGPWSDAQGQGNLIVTSSIIR